MIPSLSAQDYAVWKDNSLVLDNGVINRQISVINGRVLTKSLTIKGSDINFNAKSEDFSFEIDGKKLSGLAGWKLISIVDATDKYQGNGATLKLEGRGEAVGISIDVTYLLYPELPVIRKQLTVYNNSKKEIRLESMDVEKLIMNFNYIESVCYANYGRQKHLGTYVGDWDDPILAVHSYQKNAGIIAGNESPGVLKRISYNTVQNDVNIGLTHTDDIYPFRKYIQSGEKWASPKAFVIPYSNNSDPWIIMNTTLAIFMRKHMGLRINEYKNRPVLMSNTWVPFRFNVSDSVMLKASKAYVECGIQFSTIDVGWYVAQANIGKDKSWHENIGDWIVDAKKFPNGLKPVFAETQKMGLKSGLWISIGTGSKGYAKILEDHPEWTVKDRNNQPANLHNPNENLITFCFGTDWKDHSKNQILNLIKENNLSYVKLDLTTLTSAYINDIHQSGCYSKDHLYHKDREESFIVIYERIFEMFDELHAAVPDLYIDCTFEITGKMQLIDYAFCQHAEGNWLTNIEEPYPVGAFRIRNLNWWKSPAMPASAMLIGNMSMESPDFFQELKTLIGAFPIILGDPTKISAEKRAEIKQWADWMKLMQKKYDYDLFRQDLKGFGEPTEGSWDGWSRINTETKQGGIVGIFKQGSLDNERMISVDGLKGDAEYMIKEAPTNTFITKMTGKDLLEKGFKVKMDQKYDSQLFELELVK
jgi:alpha-galactosidase